jgi:hypothetical protein
LAYLLSLAASLLTTQNFVLSISKMATQGYLIAIPVVTVSLVRTEKDIRDLVLAWLVAAAILAMLAVLSLALYRLAPDSSILQYTRSRLGSLPAGSYLRLDLTFLNMNLACNYLTASIGLVLIAWKRRWLGSISALLLGLGCAFAAAATISPGLGGVLLLLGSWGWLISRHRRPASGLIMLVLVCGAAMAFVVAAAVTPVPHAGAPLIFQMPGTELILVASPRAMTWIAALHEFAASPLLGHGIGVDAVRVQFTTPSGIKQTLTDAHNMYLNLAAQTGMVGSIGLLLLIIHAIRISNFGKAAADAAALTVAGFGLVFLNIFAYQGLTGSFEDARHVWVVLGLLFAASRIDLRAPQT